MAEQSGLLWAFVLPVDAPYRRDEEKSRSLRSAAVGEPQRALVRAELDAAGLVEIKDAGEAGLLIEFGDALGIAAWKALTSRTRPALYFAFFADDAHQRVAWSDALPQPAEGGLARVTSLCALVRVDWAAPPASFFGPMLSRARTEFPVARYLAGLEEDLAYVTSRLALDEVETYRAGQQDEHSWASDLWRDMQPLRGFLRPCVSLQLECDDAQALAELALGWGDFRPRSDEPRAAEVRLLVTTREPPAERPDELDAYDKVVYLPRREPPGNELSDRALGAWGAVVWGAAPLCASLRAAVDLLNEAAMWRLGEL